jgi:hypothetical protein
MSKVFDYESTKIASKEGHSNTLSTDKGWPLNVGWRRPEVTNDLSSFAAVVADVSDAVPLVISADTTMLPGETCTFVIRSALKFKAFDK